LMGLCRVGLRLTRQTFADLLCPVMRTPHPAKKTTKNIPFLKFFQNYFNFTLFLPFYYKQITLPTKTTRCIYRWSPDH
ncbi:hypothetical protein ACVGW2_00630, partial [Enterobacter intestinihominis]